MGYSRLEGYELMRFRSTAFACAIILAAVFCAGMAGAAPVQTLRGVEFATGTLTSAVWDGLVSIDRDAAGNLIFVDANQTTITLTELGGVLYFADASSLTVTYPITRELIGNNVDIGISSWWGITTDTFTSRELGDISDVLLYDTVTTGAVLSYDPTTGTAGAWVAHTPMPTATALTQNTPLPTPTPVTIRGSQQIGVTSVLDGSGGRDVFIDWSAGAKTSSSLWNQTYWTSQTPMPTPVPFATTVVAPGSDSQAAGTKALIEYVIAYVADALSEIGALDITGSDNNLVRMHGTGDIQQTGISADDDNDVSGIRELSATSAAFGSLTVAGTPVPVAAPTPQTGFGGVTYPPTDGTTSQTLTTDGDGNASWADASGGGGGGTARAVAKEKRDMARVTLQERKQWLSQQFNLPK